MKPRMSRRKCDRKLRRRYCCGDAVNKTVLWTNSQAKYVRNRRRKYDGAKKLTKFSVVRRNFVDTRKMYCVYSSMNFSDSMSSLLSSAKSRDFIFLNEYYVDSSSCLLCSSDAEFSSTWEIKVESLDAARKNEDGADENKCERNDAFKRETRRYDVENRIVERIHSESLLSRERMLTYTFSEEIPKRRQNSPTFLRDCEKSRLKRGRSKCSDNSESIGDTKHLEIVVKNDEMDVNSSVNALENLLLESPLACCVEQQENMRNDGLPSREVSSIDSRRTNDACERNNCHRISTKHCPMCSQYERKNARYVLPTCIVKGATLIKNENDPWTEVLRKSTVKPIADRKITTKEYLNYGIRIDPAYAKLEKTFVRVRGNNEYTNIRPIATIFPRDAINGIEINVMDHCSLTDVVITEYTLQ